MAKVEGDKLKERYEKARAEYRAHRKPERQKHPKLKAKEDTERKIVAGEFVLFLLENGEYDRNRFMTRLGRYPVDNRRRSFSACRRLTRRPRRQNRALPCRLLNKGLTSRNMLLE